VLIFKSHLRSYKELPIRYGEFGQCHRNEPSGALHGIMRIRGFTQDDGHVFCTEDQILDECVAYTEQLQKVYRDFGFTDIIYKVATRPDSRVGADDLWDKAEYALQEALRRSGCQFVIAPGDGAFYGPKIEYTLKDALGRQWQLGTMQVDFNTAERLGGDYVTETSGRAFPVMLHRAIVGSFERFIGILLEHHAGAMPAWLAPIQASVLNISENSADYAREVAKTLQKQGLRARAICGTRKSPIKYGSIRCKRSRTSSSSATRRRQAGPFPCAPGAITTSVRCPSATSPRSSSTTSPERLESPWSEATFGPRARFVCLWAFAWGSMKGHSHRYFR
jgi:threonyl-tRNA synthetase